MYLTGLFRILLVFALISCTTNKPAAKTVKPAASPAKTMSANVAPGIEEDIFKLINEHRVKKGLASLENNFVISSVSREHSMKMATKKLPFGHDGFSERSKFIIAKIPGIKAMAENVAFGDQTARQVVDGWLNSPGHKKNIEGTYRLTGIGVARNVKSELYFTQIFAN